MRLTLYSDYSLRVLLYLSHKDQEAATITELADFYKISRNHLVKVVHNLGINGFITTSRGKHGGIRLARPAGEISVGDVVRHTEPDFDLLECFNAETDQCVVTKTCNLKSVLFEARNAFIEVLDRYTLADAAAKAQAPSEFRSIPILRV
ncbi:MAG: Rrf2 family transcriptional regulator [Burkholderiales bacterium]|nr:Rrf2 family transcriptional regulator [Burkholderiales bacterium]